MQPHRTDLRYEDGGKDMVRHWFLIMMIGAKWHISVLVDEAASKTGDLYIRSVCFSPDGKLLATGAEDKQIRVSTPRSSALPRHLIPDLVARSI